jgi:hypothetical protein
MDDESRPTSTKHPDVDVAKPVVTDENSGPRASDGFQPLDLTMTKSRSVVSDNEGFQGRPPVVGDAKPVVRATDDVKPATTTVELLLLVVDVTRLAVMVSDGEKPVVVTATGNVKPAAMTARRRMSPRRLPPEPEMMSRVE